MTGQATMRDESADRVAVFTDGYPEVDVVVPERFVLSIPPGADLAATADNRSCVAPACLSAHSSAASPAA